VLGRLAVDGAKPGSLRVDRGPEFAGHNKATPGVLGFFTMPAILLDDGRRRSNGGEWSFIGSRNVDAECTGCRRAAA
jgi:hypothetical protein